MHASERSHGHPHTHIHTHTHTSTQARLKAGSHTNKQLETHTHTLCLSLSISISRSLDLSLVSAQGCRYNASLTLPLSTTSMIVFFPASTPRVELFSGGGELDHHRMQTKAHAHTLPVSPQA